MQTSSPSKLLLLMLLSIMVFQTTALKHIWELEAQARLLNVILLLAFSVYFLYGLITLRVELKLWVFYLFPGLLVFSGMLLNIGRNSISDPGNLSLLGLLIPWGAYLCVPKWMKKDSHFDISLWPIYYYFMLFCVVTSLYEYSQLFFGSGVPIRMVETSGGTFGAGMFSLFFVTLSGSVEFRNYSAFLEPGAFGVFLIPVIAWAFLQKRYIGLALLLFGAYTAQSLGVYISLCLLVISMYISLNKRVLSFPTALLFLAILVVLTQLDYFQRVYEQKGQSREIRVENIVEGVTELPTLLMEVPFGFKFDSTRLGTQEEGDASSKFSTIMPIYYFGIGGVLSFLGYLFIVMQSVFIYVMAIPKREFLIEEKAVIVCFPPMAALLVQRTTVWESAIFAFLFAPTIIRYLSVHYRCDVRQIKGNCS